jgi:hypothetical protein
VGAGRGFAIRGGRQLADQLIRADPEQFAQQVEKIRARRAGHGIDDAP